MVKKQKRDNDVQFMNARTDNSCLHRCRRNFCILTGLFEIVTARNYKFLHGSTHFCTELQNNCTALDQLESSNFFHLYDYIA